MRSLGYVAIAFERAEDLLKSRRRRSVSCVIADVQMPGMTGLELHDRLVASREPIPTILITAFADETARERAMQAGVIGCLTKPFSEDDLLACISSVPARKNQLVTEKRSDTFRLRRCSIRSPWITIQFHQLSP
jgi:FixJ family two-component response regulator